MKNVKRLLFAGLTTLSLVLLFFPVAKFEAGRSAIGLLAEWKEQSIALAIWLILAILAMAAAVLLDCLGQGRRSLTAAAAAAAFSAVSLLALGWIYASPAWGGVGAALCLLVSAGLACTELLPQRRTAASTDLQPGRARKAASKPQPPESLPEKAPVPEAPEAAEPQAPAMLPPAEEPAPSALPVGALTALCSEYAGAVLPLEHMSSVTLGRDPALCNLVIHDSRMSRQHCIVTYNGVNDTYLLLDTSSNGTFLEGGQRIPKNYAMEVQPGLRFYLGNPENSFILGKQA